MFLTLNRLMTRVRFAQRFVMSTMLVVMGMISIMTFSTPAFAATQRQPNIVIIFTDDQGYGDAGCFGATDIATPNIDRMAKQGLRLTNFYVPCTVCTPSRAALLSGCYPKRVGLHKAVIFPESKYGLNPKEQLLPELLKEAGYTTAMFGKWHLGHHQSLMPNAQGFDYYFGVPYSNDMSHAHMSKSKWGKKRIANGYPKLPLYRNTTLLEHEPDQRFLTKRYTEEACQWITKNKAKPFFLYLPHSMPHVPWYRSKPFAGKSERGVYGDVIEEIDWSVGQILKTLKDNGLDDNTFVIFTSDNGGQSRIKKGAINTPLRGGKATTWEGGSRVLAVMRWPGQLAVGQDRDQLLVSFDLLPTICKLAGASLPKEKIDGNDIWHILSKPAQKQAGRTLIFYNRDGNAEAIRHGQWKLHLGKRKTTKGFPQLYNLDKDMAEQNNVADKHEELVKELTKMLKDFDAKLSKETRAVKKF